MIEYKVSWDMWPMFWNKPNRTEKIYRDKKEALDHLEGLKSMQANHEPRPCDKHVWNIKLEERKIVEENWKEI